MLYSRVLTLEVASLFAGLFCDFLRARRGCRGARAISTTVLRGISRGNEIFLLYVRTNWLYVREIIQISIVHGGLSYLFVLVLHACKNGLKVGT